MNYSVKGVLNCSDIQNINMKTKLAIESNICEVLSKGAMRRANLRKPEDENIPDAWSSAERIQEELTLGNGI